MKPAMTIDEALEYADLWSKGITIREDSTGWRVVCMLLAEEVRRLRTPSNIAPFIVKQYSDGERPIIKGNGFDGLEIGEDREEAERFVAFVNAAISQAILGEREACAKVCENRAEERFVEFGVIETDTGAGYYDGKAADEHESRDEEDESCAAAIRARSKKTEGA
jgi:hypothetical protein